MSDSKFDSMLGKLRKFKDELEKAKKLLDVERLHRESAMKKIPQVRPGPGSSPEHTLGNKAPAKVIKYDESRQSGVNQEPPMTQEEKTKKAEFLAMSKHGQWSLGKTEHVGQDNSKAKTGKGKPMALTPEKESPHNDPKGEPYAGSGKDRMSKMDEPHKDDPNHEKKEKKIAKDIKAKAQKLDDMHKMDDATTMQGPISSTVAMKMDEGSAPGGDSSISGIEKKDLPKDAEYQKHKKEPKERA